MSTLRTQKEQLSTSARHAASAPQKHCQSGRIKPFKPFPLIAPLFSKTVGGMSKADAGPSPSIEALSATSAPSSEGYVRLHITPFNDRLLNRYIAPSVLPLATGISFHTLQNFPEKPFGYVELPKMVAEKMKKKLNGSILKGQKVKIEDAKPERSKRKADEGEDEVPADKSGKSKKPKRKEEQGVLPGAELKEGRKVKRGWTEPVERGAKKNKKKRRRDSEEKKGKDSEPSKYTQEPEMLFRTKPSTQSVDPNPETAKTKKKDKKGKSVVHEFENRRILRNGAVGAENHELAREYVEGKGWVDSSDNVVEAEKKGKKTAPPASSADARHGQDKEKEQIVEHTSTATDPEQLARDQRKAEKRKKRDERNARRATKRAQEAAENPADADAQGQQEQKQNWTASSTALEALYKRRGVSDITAPLHLPSSTKTSPTKPPPIDTAAASKFSFAFGKAGGDDEDEEGDSVPPLTPFSREDRETRSVRSAAPTPDTAAIGRTFSFSFMGGDKDDSDDDEGDAEAGTANDEESDGQEVGVGSNALSNVHPERLGQVEKEESEFSRWFWEHRGESNRAWKKRRKEAMKGKRKRENRRIGRKVV